MFPFRCTHKHIDPYVAAALQTETVCEAIQDSSPSRFIERRHANDDLRREVKVGWGRS
jgi:hypothetical protein